MHAHEQLCDWFFKFFLEGLEGDADIVAFKELKCFFLQLKSLFAQIEPF